MNKNINIEQVVETARKAMDDKKAENIKVIYIGEISSVTDYFVICSASNSSQLEAIVDNVSEELGKLSVYSKKQEGNRNSGWILLDYGDVVVHVFQREDREFYNLERIWSDGKFL
ncbi:MAG: ribosome silencing factor [Lachnospiraceae bacterium]|nr:ribosome silencing factor [Lachnospiraceae bacterium]